MGVSQRSGVASETLIQNIHNLTFIVPNLPELYKLVAVISLCLNQLKVSEFVGFCHPSHQARNH